MLLPELRRISVISSFFSMVLQASCFLLSIAYLNFVNIIRKQ